MSAPLQLYVCMYLCTCFCALRYCYIARGNPRHAKSILLPSFLQIAACVLLQLLQLRFSAMLVTDCLPCLFPLIDPRCIFHVILPRAAASTNRSQRDRLCPSSTFRYLDERERGKICGKLDSRILFRAARGAIWECSLHDIRQFSHSAGFYNTIR